MPEQNVAHDIEINEWEQPLPDFARVATRYPHYQLDLTADYRAYWRTTGASVGGNISQQVTNCWLPPTMPGPTGSMHSGSLTKEYSAPE
jgi:hypothetical protein